MTDMPYFMCAAHAACRDTAKGDISWFFAEAQEFCADAEVSVVFRRFDERCRVTFNWYMTYDEVYNLMVTTLRMRG